MSFTAWLSIAALCCAGAMSPGPSLAVVIRNTLHGNRMQGVLTGLSHALGIMFYAFITVVGIGVLITSSPLVFAILKYAGAAFLLWLGYQALTSQSKAGDALDAQGAAGRHDINGIRDGIFISIFNPKIILFFLALFSQFVSPDAGWNETAIITATAGVIDAGWYVLVALFISQTSVLHFLRQRIGLIDKVFGVLLIVIAVRVAL